MQKKAIGEFASQSEVCWTNSVGLSYRVLIITVSIVVGFSFEFIRVLLIHWTIRSVVNRRRSRVFVWGRLIVLMKWPRLHGRSPLRNSSGDHRALVWRSQTDFRANGVSVQTGLRTVLNPDSLEMIRIFPNPVKPKSAQETLSSENVSGFKRNVWSRSGKAQRSSGASVAWENRLPGEAIEWGDDVAGLCERVFLSWEFEMKI